MTKKTTLQAIDLFAGIGGIRLGFESAGFKVVYSNDFDKHASQTYRHNFGEINEGDIREIALEPIPSFNILLAGFPCQSFSQLGRGLGFKDPRGNLFFEVERILHNRTPDAFFLENVRHLETHDNGKTFLEIRKALEGRLGYHIYSKVLNAKNFGLPQNRERIYIVGFREDLPFKFPEPTNRRLAGVKSVLEKNVAPRFYLSAKYLSGLEKHKRRHSKMGHGFGYEILEPNSIAHTLVAGNMGRERNLIQDKKNIKYDKKLLTKRNTKGVRKLTIREFARLQGFPDWYTFPVSDNQAYKQIGNSVSVPVVAAIAKQIKKTLEKNITAARRKR